MPPLVEIAPDYPHSRDSMTSYIVCVMRIMRVRFIFYISWVPPLAAQLNLSSTLVRSETTLTKRATPFHPNPGGIHTRRPCNCGFARDRHRGDRCTRPTSSGLRVKHRRRGSRGSHINRCD